MNSNHIRKSSHIKKQLQHLLEQYNITHVTADSRDVKANSVFFAIKGTGQDGNDYIDQAIEKNAALICTDNKQIAERYQAPEGQAPEKSQAAEGKDAEKYQAAEIQAAEAQAPEKYQATEGKDAEKYQVAEMQAAEAQAPEKYQATEGKDAEKYQVAEMQVPEKYQALVPCVYFSNNRLALAIAAGILYPKSPNLIAVTGTNGKSSVVSYIFQILDKLKISVASLGTIGIDTNSQEFISYQKNWSDITNENETAYTPSLTTADPVALRKILELMNKSHIDYCALEASSHGLDQDRLGDILMHAAAFTSFSQDHLDYHTTIKAYLNAKMKLFLKHMQPNAKTIINGDMDLETLKYIIDILDNNKIYFSLVVSMENWTANYDEFFYHIKYYKYYLAEENIIITNISGNINQQEITFEFMSGEPSYTLRTPILGSFQATNLLIAAKLVDNLNISSLNFDDIIDSLGKLYAVKGRLEKVIIDDSGNDDDIVKDHNTQMPVHIFIDYAHTPDALEKSLIELKKLKEEKSKLYLIFGCGGDRDKTKRPIMGEIAAKYADCVIVSNDNPRNEDPQKIIEEILANLSQSCNIEAILDRRQAIIYTITELMSKNDILLIAGKGHENYQIINDKIYPLNDLEIARNALEIKILDEHNKQ